MYLPHVSHRDACIMSWYSRQLTDALDTYYETYDLSASVIAYRALGKGNYHFAQEAFAFAAAYGPVDILGFDVTKFFDNLDHRLLKARLKELLGVGKLAADWYKVFRAITAYHYVALDDLSSHPVFGPRMKIRDGKPIATVCELKAAGIRFQANPTSGIGIPQGTPISAALSNVYMMRFDRELQSYATRIGGFYRRYSDDILFICKPEQTPEVERLVRQLIAQEGLQLNDGKTERTRFDATSPSPQRRLAQYLGFTFDEGGVAIRASSLSRQWRKMRRAVKRTRLAAQSAIAAGKAKQVYTKKLRRRFTALPGRNFPSYARRSASAFESGGQRIRRQLRKLERAAEREINSLKALEPAKASSQ